MAFVCRETVMLDPTLIWSNSDAAENLKVYASDFLKTKKEDILLKYYCETAKVKAKAVW